MILSILNALKKARKTIFKLAKKGLINGTEGIKILLSAIAKSIVKGIIINFITFVVTVVLIITITIGAVSALVDNVISTIGGWFGFNKTTETYNEMLTDEKVKELLDYGININPRNLPVYEEIERNSCKIENHMESEPYKVQVPMKIKTVVKIPSNNSINTETTNDTVDYILDLEKRVKPYRLRWEFVSAIDILKDKAIKENPQDREYIKDMQEKLKTYFYWDFNKYTKDVTYTVDYFRKKYKNGTLISNKWTKTVETTKYYPLDIPIKISGVFKDYNFIIDEDVVTKDESSSEPIVYDEYSWIEQEWTGDYLKDDTGHFVLDEEGNKIKEYEYVSYKVIKYKRTKTKVVEDIIKRIEETPNFKLKNYFANNDIALEDLDMVYSLIEQMPNTSLLLQDLEDVMDYYSIGIADIMQYNYNLLNIDIKIDPSEIEKTANIPYFSQRDERWAYLPYGDASYYPDNTIKRTGCGTTSVAMIVMGLGGYSSKIDLNKDGILDPYEVSKWSYEHGHKVEPTGGSYWSLFPAFAEETGLTVRQYSPSQYELVKEELLKGNPVIASMKPPTFTSSGHFIVLVGFDEDGKVIVNDPNSKSRSYPQSKWDFANPIVAEAKGFFAFEKK